MPIVEWVGQSRRDEDNTQAEPSRLVNCYREPAGGDRTRFILKSVLGMKAFADLSTVFMRDAVEIEGIVYAVAGGRLYSVNASAAASDLGAVQDSAETTICGNNGNVCITAGGRYYVWDGETLTQPAAGAFDSFGSAVFLGQRTFLTERGGRRVQWSAVADPDSLDALAFATKESRDDKVIRAVAVAENLWVFGEKSVEVWGLTGGSEVVTPLRTIEVGLKSHGLLATMPGGAFFVGSDGVVYVISDGGGAAVQPISTTGVETAVAVGEGMRCFYYEDEGHKFCVIRFRDRPAWCFDLATGEWHERGEGAQHTRWAAVAAVKAFGHWHVGTDLGKLHRLARTNADVGQPLLRRAVSRSLWQGGERFTVAELELYGQVGGTSYIGYDPEFLSAGGGFFMSAGGEYLLQSGTRARQVDVHCWLRVSKSHGKTWGLAKQRSLGKLGEYAKRVVWRALGRGRFFVFELNCAAPVDLPVFCDARVRLEA